MLELLVLLLVAVLVLVIVYFLVGRMPLDGNAKNMIHIVVAILLILFILYRLGVLSGL